MNWGYRQDLDIGQVSVSPGPVSNLQGHLQSSNFMTLMTKELTVSSGRTRKILRKIEEHQASSVYKSCCRVLTETSTWKQSSFSSHGFNQQCLMFCDICHYCVQNYWWGTAHSLARISCIMFKTTITTVLQQLLKILQFSPPPPLHREEK